MAEVNVEKSHSPNRRKIRAKKSPTKIDMTPMVDLAFLLLTFFMLAAKFLKPVVMEINMPEKQGEPPLVKPENVLNLALAENNKIYYFSGKPNPKIKLTNYSSGGIRKILFAIKAENPEIKILIKPTDDSNYKNIVDIFDEMDIVKIPWYALIDITPKELETIKLSKL